MLYHLKWKRDKTDEKLRKAAELHKVKIPEAIQNPPTVARANLIYWDCFNDLCGDRQMGSGVGYIPWTSIYTWAQSQGITDPDEFQELRFVVSKLEEFWVDYFRVEQTAKAAQPKPKPKKKAI